jgi:hypothetical protein
MGGQQRGHKETNPATTVASVWGVWQRVRRTLLTSANDVPWWKTKIGGLWPLTDASFSSPTDGLRLGLLPHFFAAIKADMEK